MHKRPTRVPQYGNSMSWNRMYSALEKKRNCYSREYIQPEKHFIGPNRRGMNAIDEKVLKFVLLKLKNGFPYYQIDDTDERIQSYNPSEGTVAVFQIQYQGG